MEIANGEKKVQKNVVWALLCYLGPLIIIPLVSSTRKDPYVKFHIKQGALLIVAWVILSVLSFHVPVIGWLLGIIIWLVLAVFSVLGVVNAIIGKEAPLPLIGKYVAKAKKSSEDIDSTFCEHKIETKKIPESIENKEGFDPIKKLFKKSFIEKRLSPVHIPVKVIWLMIFGGVFLILTNIGMWLYFLLEGASYARVTDWTGYGHAAVLALAASSFFIIIGSIYELREERNIFFYIGIMMIFNQPSKIFRYMRLFPAAFIFTLLETIVIFLILANCIKLLRFWEERNSTSTADTGE